MNDIYEQKAKKYKYKYLKLKREYIGGGDDENTETKYLFQCSYSKTWIEASIWQKQLINLKDENGNSIGKYNEKTFIYINSTHEIINITNIKEIEKRCKFFLFKLPKYTSRYTYDINKSKLEIINIINKILNTNNDISIINIDNKNIDTNNHDLYFIQTKKPDYEWYICNEVWKKNILYNLYNNNKKINNILFKYLQNINILNNNYYLVFKYNEINYISYILEKNEQRIQFTIINLTDGTYEIVLYPLNPIIPKWFDLDINNDNIKKFKDVIKYSNDENNYIPKLNDENNYIPKLNDENSENKNFFKQIISFISSPKKKIQDILKEIQQYQQQQQQQKELQQQKKEKEKEKEKEIQQKEQEIQKEKEKQQQKEKEQKDNCDFYYDISFNNQKFNKNKNKYNQLATIFDPNNNGKNTKCYINDAIKYYKLNFKELEYEKCNKCANVLSKELIDEYDKYLNNKK